MFIPEIMCPCLKPNLKPIDSLPSPIPLLESKPK